MRKAVITLYMNDPMGKRWAAILEAARRAEQELGAEIVIIKKTSKKYGLETDPPPCPSVMINGKFISKKDLVTYEQIRNVILSEK